MILATEFSYIIFHKVCVGFALDCNIVAVVGGRSKNAPTESLAVSRCQMPRLVEHIFDEDAVALCGIVDEHVGNGADELAASNYRAAGQESG